MDVIERLTKQGKELGYEGETLQTFVKEQQIQLRDERQAMREAREAEARIEREKLELIVMEKTMDARRKNARLSGKTN